VSPRRVIESGVFAKLAEAIDAAAPDEKLDRLLGEMEGCPPTR
jgi:hypothetical protein